MEKHEECGTANRVYCPIPTCSAFISYSLFPEGLRPAVYKYPEFTAEAGPRGLAAEHGQAALESQADIRNPSNINEQQESAETAPQPPCIACPKCNASICCSCKQLAHVDSTCATPSVDPEFEQLLVKLKIKRCPKCQVGVRKMFGCSAMTCRCGHNWCWYCQLPLWACETNTCAEAEAETGSDDDGDIAEGGEEPARRGAEDVNDFDAGGHRRWENDEFDFGPEPYPVSVRDYWACRHHWVDIVVEANGYLHRHLACERCGGTVHDANENEDGQGAGDLSEEAASQGMNMMLCQFCNQLICRQCYAAAR